MLNTQQASEASNEKGLQAVLGADLSTLLTIFVTTVGDAENFRDCMAHLERQSVRFELNVIDRVAPLSAAFQQMIDVCRTPFYVQVDEDMILHPGAIETLFEDISAAPSTTAVVCRPLWDCDIQGPLYGLKVYRHDIVRRFPYQDSFSCERAQQEQIEAAGYEMMFWPLEGRQSCLGEHGKHYTTRSIFMRWRRLIQKRRLYGEHVARGVPGPQFLLERYQSDPNRLNLYALLGAVAGLAEELPADKEADFREVCASFQRLTKEFSD